MGVKVTFPFSGFPFFNGRRPLSVQGEAECEVVSVTPAPTRSKDLPFPPGEPELIEWRVNTVEIWAGRKGRTVADLNADEWLRQDLIQWIRGKHGYTIENMLRKLYRSTLAKAPKGETSI